MKKLTRNDNSKQGQQMTMVQSAPESVSISLKILKTNIDGAEVNSVNAREIHSYINSNQDYSDWIKKRLKSLGAVENIDYVIFHKKMEKRGRPQKEYIVTTDIGKHLGMMERNKEGREIRQHFIDIEKTSISAISSPMSELDMIIASAQEQKKLQEKVEKLEETVYQVQNKMAEDVAEVIREVKDKQIIPTGYIPIGTIAEMWDTGLSRGTLKIIARIYNVDTAYYEYQNESMPRPQQHTAVQINSMRWAIGQFIRTINKRTDKRFYSPQYKGGATGFSMSEDIWDMYGINEPKWN